MIRKIKILYIIDTSKPGGGEKVLKNLVEGINKDRFELFVILPDKGWLYEKLKGNLSVTVSIISGTGSLNFVYLFQLLKFVVENKIDLIHSHLLGVSLYSSTAGFISNTPVVCTIHGAVDSHHRMAWIKLFITGLFAKKIIFVSNHLRSFFVDHFLIAKNKCITIHNGILVKNRIGKKSSKMRYQLGFSKNHILIGSVGNVTVSKGYDVLLQSAKIVVEKYQNFHFLIAGDKRGKLYKELLVIRKEYKLEKNVHFIGFIDAVNQFLDILDIFVLSSISEGFSLSTIEAMNAGLPVVVTKCGGPEEIVINKKNGILVSSENANELAFEIMELIKNKQRGKNLGLAAMQTVLEKFDISTMVEKHSNLYLALSGR